MSREHAKGRIRAGLSKDARVAHHQEAVLRARDGHVQQVRAPVHEAGLRLDVIHQREQHDPSFRPLQRMGSSDDDLFGNASRVIVFAKELPDQYRLLLEWGDHANDLGLVDLGIRLSQTTKVTCEPIHDALGFFTVDATREPGDARATNLN